MQPLNSEFSLVPSTSTSSSSSLSDLKPDNDILISSGSGPESAGEEPQGNQGSKALPPPILKLLHFILIWQTIFKISNAVISMLLRLLKAFCLTLGTAFNCMPLKNATTAMPLTKATLKKILELNEPMFTEYIVCQKCNLHS